MPWGATRPAVPTQGDPPCREARRSPPSRSPGRASWPAPPPASARARRAPRRRANRAPKPAGRRSRAPRPRGFGHFGHGGPGGEVHAVEVVPDKAGTGLHHRDRGQRHDHRGRRRAPARSRLKEGTSSVTYATPTITIPSGATVLLDGATSSLEKLKAGDHVSISSSSEGTTVFATDSSFQPGEGHGGPMGGPPPQGAAPPEPALLSLGRERAPAAGYRGRHEREAFERNPQAAGARVDAAENRFAIAAGAIALVAGIACWPPRAAPRRRSRPRCCSASPADRVRLADLPDRRAERRRRPAPPPARLSPADPA